VTIEAIQEFLQNHLSLIVRSLAEAIKTSGIQYLQLAAAALLARTEALQPCSPKMPAQPAIGSSLGVAECPVQDCCSFLDD
jgi:hypothetical protein